MPGGPISRVLVVEDDASLAESIITGLMDEGFSVEHAPDGNTAWQAVRSAGWDLVILDWWLPGQDGLTILRRYRDGGGTTPVLFLTAGDAVSDRVRGLDGGADDYLCKPFAFEELRLASAPDPTAQGRRGHDTRLSRRAACDLVAQRGQRAGCPLELTAKELGLLAFFLDHPGEILSRTRIYGQVWGEDYDFISNTLDVHIKELRRKLETRGPRLIHTLAAGDTSSETSIPGHGGKAMSLVTRFSVFFLVALALALAGFSGCLYYLVGLQLSVALDAELEATLDGFPGGLASHSERVSWAVYGDQGQRLESSPDDGRAMILDGRDLTPLAIDVAMTIKGADGTRWRALVRPFGGRRRRGPREGRRPGSGRIDEERIGDRGKQEASAPSQLNVGVNRTGGIGETHGYKEVPMIKKYVVRLTDEERGVCQAIVKKLKGSSEKVRRVEFLLKADADGPGWPDARSLKPSTVGYKLLRKSGSD